MFALTGKSRGKSRIAPKRRELDGRLVVPRMLRRPARLFSKIFAGDITPIEFDYEKAGDRVAA